MIDEKQGLKDIRIYQGNIIHSYIQNFHYLCTDIDMEKKIVYIKDYFLLIFQKFIHILVIQECLKQIINSYK
jgi:hypothetical protein